jgi:hypothetical protein
VNWRRCQIAPSGCLVSRYLLITGRATLLSRRPSSPEQLRSLSLSVADPLAFAAGAAPSRVRSVF